MHFAVLTFICLYLTSTIVTANCSNVQYEIEAAVAGAFVETPKVQQIALQLLKQVHQLATAQRLRAVAKPSLSSQDIEAMVDQVFAKTTRADTGSVGDDTQRILAVLAGKGNLRETMTLIYEAVNNFSKKNLFEGAWGTPISSMLREEVARLLKSPADEQKWLKANNLTFVDTALLLAKDKHEKSTSIRLRKRKDKPFTQYCYSPLFSPVAETTIRKCRCESEEFAAKNTIKCRVGDSSKGKPQPKANEVIYPLLGQYETDNMFPELLKSRVFKSVRAKLYDNKTQLTWIPGLNYYKIPLYVSPKQIQSCRNSTEIKHLTTNPGIRVATALGLPFVSGPSGTSDVFYQLSSYFSFTKEKKLLLKKALLAWMVPARDHSFHEVLQTAHDRKIINYQCSSGNKKAMSMAPAECLFSGLSLTTKEKGAVARNLRLAFKRLRIRIDKYKSDDDMITAAKKKYNAISREIAGQRSKEIKNIYKACSHLK